MAVFFKKERFADPTRKDAPKLYYPRLVTLGQSVGLDTVAYKMKNVSSLSRGDIHSVLINFVEAMRECLYAGQTVNVQDFGVFSLSCEGEGVTDVKECTAEKIKQVHINFRPSSSLKVSLADTRSGEKIEFIDLQAYIDAQKKGPGAGEGDDGNGDDGNGDDGGGSGSGEGSGGGVVDDDPLG